MDGFPYQVLLRLLIHAALSWDAIDGEQAAKGLNPFDLPPRRFFNFLQYWLVNHVKDPERFLQELEEPLPGQKITETSALVEAERDEFGAFMATMTGGRATIPGGK